MQKIELHLIATGASRENGQVERVMSLLKRMLTAVESSQRSWQDALGEIQIATNCTINRITKSSPLELLIGKEARPLNMLPIVEENSYVDINFVRKMAKENMAKNALYEKVRFDKNKAKFSRFKVGDYVFLRNEERHQTKLDQKFKGPFLVTEILEGDRYILKSLANNRTYKYSHESLRGMPKEEIPRELYMYDDNDEVERDVRDPLVDSNEGESVERVARNILVDSNMNVDAERGVIDGLVDSN